MSCMFADANLDNKIKSVLTKKVGLEQEEIDLLVSVILSQLKEEENNEEN